MKTVFIVNPKAGQGECVTKLTNAIKNIGAELYITRSPGDAIRFVSEYGAARFIACGGDGTLNEVLNGAMAHERAQVGVIPIGTGNDFCRNFLNSEFNDVSAQVNGDVVKCDAIRYETDVGHGYCINMFNMGFDCNVADLTSKIKAKPFVFGSLAYFLSILIMLIKKKGADIKIEADGEIKSNGAILLASIANGSYCGGGVRSNPLASVWDGFINMNIVNDISRFSFIKLLPHYMRGDFLNLPNIENVINSLKCKKVIVTPNKGEMKLCVDGEILTVGRAEFEIIHNAFDFVIPSKRLEQ